ncbi:hypothetical protein Tco_1109586 [Tanacetum coccineum]
MGKGKLDHLLLHLVNGAAVKTTERVDPSFSVWMENFWQEGLQQKMNVASRREENYVESGTPDLESGWKTSGQENDKEMNVQPELEVQHSILSSQAHTLLSSQPPPHSPPPRSTATRWSDIIKLLSARVKEEMWCCEHHANLTVMPGTQDRGCGYFMWMDDLRLHISSSSGSSTPPSYSPGTSTRPSYSPGSSRSAQNLGKAECSNCKFLAEKIKTLEAKIKILEGALEMERHPEKHTLDSAAILHELYNEMGKLMEDSSNTNQWGKKEAGSSPPSSGKWAAKRKLMMRVGPLILSLDGKLLGPRRMTKKINVHPEWLILQTLTNGAKRKLDHLLLHLVNGLLWKTNDESETPHSQSRWKTYWAKKDDKEDQCAS